MIYVISGSNSYLRDQRIAELTKHKSVERIDGLVADKQALLDITRGQTLFSSERTVVINQLSANKVVWNEVAHIFDTVTSSTMLIMLEPGIDKRTTSYKWLQKNATIEHFDEPTDRDSAATLRWMRELSASKQCKLTDSAAQHILQRVGNNQAHLAMALEKVSLLPEITKTTIDDVVDARLQENIFHLFDVALQHDTIRLKTIIDTLKLTENAYKVMGLLSSQLFQLVLLTHANGSVSRVHADTAMSEYGLRQQASLAKQLTTQDVTAMVRAFSKADMRLKSTDNEPWVVVEACLLSVQQLAIQRT